MHDVGFLEENRTGRVDGRTTILVNFSESATLDHHHHRSGMCVPSCLPSRLKDQICLKHFAGPFYV